jgi:hypothetical protein
MADSEPVISPWPNLEIELLRTPAYKKNASIACLRDHPELAAAFCGRG